MPQVLALRRCPSISRSMADPILHPDSGRDPVDAPLLEALEEGRLSRGFVDEIGDRLDSGDDEAVRKLVAPLRPADIAELFAMVAENDRTALARAIGDALDAEVIAELNDYVREDVLAGMSVGAVADVVTQLDTDDAVALIEDLDDREQQQVLSALTPADRADIQAALN